MTPTRAKQHYKANLKEPVSIRRIIGTGVGKTDNTYDTVGRVFKGERKELVGGVAQQDITAIVYAQDLLDAGLPSDVKIGDYLIDQDDLEYSVYEVKFRRVKAVMIAYELTVRG
jgi:hypothetical protein